jgi:hypothetical protein
MQKFDAFFSDPEAAVADFLNHTTTLERPHLCSLHLPECADRHCECQPAVALYRISAENTELILSTGQPELEQEFKDRQIRDVLGLECFRQHWNRTTFPGFKISKC